MHDSKLTALRDVLFSGTAREVEARPNGELREIVNLPEESEPTLTVQFPDFKPTKLAPRTFGAK